MNRWLQTKQYRCSKCLTVYLHDQAHAHACHECPLRPAARRALLLAAGRIYCPATEKDR